MLIILTGLWFRCIFRSIGGLLSKSLNTRLAASFASGTFGAKGAFLPAKIAEKRITPAILHI